MKQEIDARRRVRISLFSGQGSPAGTYLFDAQGNFLEVKAGRPLAEKEIILLAGEVRKMPRISGREKRELLWEGERISLSILRYIHMTLGELPDIQAACIPDREAVADCGQNRRLTYRQLKEERQEWEEEERPERSAPDSGGPYKSRLLNDCSRILEKSDQWAFYALLLTLPLLCVITVILLLFGQRPDSAIRVFTETSDWTLSTEISPPEVMVDAHYLCTVALRGHRGLVRPVRMGLRRGEKIVVNRQLCVANAFEQLLEERTPRFHRAVRNFYDTCGYPISRHIRTPLAADIVYLLMKPLEWLFTAVLYLFDTKPEDRIARQYLPDIGCPVNGSVVK